MAEVKRSKREFLKMYVATSECERCLHARYLSSKGNSKYRSFRALDRGRKEARLGGSLWSHVLREPCGDNRIRVSDVAFLAHRKICLS